MAHKDKSESECSQLQKNTITPATTRLYDHADGCCRLFDSYLSHPHAGSFDAVETQKARFNIWAANLGAFTYQNASLDHRLRDNPEIRDMVHQLLDVLQRNLQYGTCANVIVKLFSYIDLSAINIDKQQAALNTRGEKRTTAKNLQPLLSSKSPTNNLEIIEATIDRLQKLAIIIRKSSTESRRVRAATLIQGDADNFEEFALRMVKHRYKDADEMLCEQLSASIALRRRHFIYNQRHQQKLEYKRQNHVPEARQAPIICSRTAFTSQGPPRLWTFLKGAPQLIIPHHAPPSQTNASILDSKKARNFFSCDYKPDISTISAGVTIQDKSVEYPLAPMLKKGQKECICPYCSELLPASKLGSRSWRRHVDADLKPYVCISEECRETLPLFIEFQEWFQHMQESHSLEWPQNVHKMMWCCPVCHFHEPFRSKIDFEEHMKASHAEKFTESQILTLTRRSMRLFPRAPSTCPLCNCIPEDICEIIQEQGDKVPDLLAKHIAGHLKSLSFLSLPYRDDIDKVSSEASRDAFFGRQEEMTKERDTVLDSNIAHTPLSCSDKDPLARIPDEQLSIDSISTEEWEAGESGIRNSLEFESAELWEFMSPEPYNMEEDRLLQPFIARATGSPATNRPANLPVLPTIPLLALKPFQCTFCLAQCAGEMEWLEHEMSCHFQNPWLTDRFIDDSHRSCNSSRSWQQGGRYFWTCGFCQMVICTWEERQEHFAEHFSTGDTMINWDPLASPFPWRSESGDPANTGVCWDLQSLLSLQRPTLEDSINQSGYSRKRPHTCEICQVAHRSLEAYMRHVRHWHSPRDAWSCPNVPYTNLADFFDESSDQTGNRCRACDERLQRPDNLDPELQIRHLRLEHAFGECGSWGTFYNENQFFLHLASAHSVKFTRVKGLMDLCRADCRPPALA